MASNSGAQAGIEHSPPPLSSISPNQDMVVNTASSHTVTSAPELVVALTKPTRRTYTKTQPAAVNVNLNLASPFLGLEEVLGDDLTHATRDFPTAVRGIERLSKWSGGSFPKYLQMAMQNPRLYSALDSRISNDMTDDTHGTETMLDERSNELESDLQAALDFPPLTTTSKLPSQAVGSDQQSAPDASSSKRQKMVRNKANVDQGRNVDVESKKKISDNSVEAVVPTLATNARALAALSSSLSANGTARSSDICLLLHCFADTQVHSYFQILRLPRVFSSARQCTSPHLSGSARRSSSA